MIENIMERHTLMRFLNLEEVAVTAKFLWSDRVSSFSGQIFEINDSLRVKKGSSFKSLLKDLLDDMDSDGWKSVWWKENNPANNKLREKRANSYASKNTLLLEKYHNLSW